MSARRRLGKSVIHCLDTSVACRGARLLRGHFGCRWGPTPALLPLLAGGARRVVRGEIGCSKWKKTLAYLLVLPGSRARIVRCGGRYAALIIHCVSEKNVPNLASCSFDKHGLILIIFGRQHQHNFKNDMHIELSLSLHVYFLAFTHSLTAALDQLRVVASSTSNDPGPRSR